MLSKTDWTIEAQSIIGFGTGTCFGIGIACMMHGSPLGMIPTAFAGTLFLCEISSIIKHRKDKEQEVKND